MIVITFLGTVSGIPTKERNHPAIVLEYFVSNILNLGYFGLRFEVEAIDVPFFGEKETLIDETKEYEIYSIPVLHTVPAVGYCFKEKDRWSIDVKKLRELGLRRGRWLRSLKRKKEVKIGGKVVKIEDVATKRRGLKIVYSGDTKPCENILKISRGADLLIHDATFLEEGERRGHADVKEAARIAKKAEVKQLILTHISRRYTSTEEIEREARKIFPNTKVAHDFMRIELRSS